jgi:hypothetical protein
MSTVTGYYQEAELALAAYSNLTCKREWGRAKLTAWSDRVTPQDIDEIRP